MFNKLFGNNTSALKAELAHTVRLLSRAMNRCGVRSDEVLAYEAKIAHLEAALGF